MDLLLLRSVHKEQLKVNDSWAGADFRADWGMNLRLHCAGWVNRHQQFLIAYCQKKRRGEAIAPAQSWPDVNSATTNLIRWHTLRPMLNRQLQITSLLAASLLMITSFCAAADTSDWTPLFDGKSLLGWKANEHPDTFKVVDGVIVAQGERAHLFYTGTADSQPDFKNFELELEVFAKPGANSGVYFHSAFQDSGWPEQGFEVQINNSQLQHGEYLELKKTGSLYGVRNIHKPTAPDNEWFTLQVSLRANRVLIRVNQALLVDYVEPSLSGADRHRRLTRSRFI